MSRSRRRDRRRRARPSAGHRRARATGACRAGRRPAPSAARGSAHVARPSRGRTSRGTVPPRIRNLEGGVGGAERQVGEPGAVLVHVAHRSDPVPGLVDEVLGEVITLLRRRRRLHLRGAGVQVRVELIVGPADDPVEGVEALPSRPVRERADGSDLVLRDLVPLAEHAGRVAVLPQGPAQRSGVQRSDTRVARCAGGETVTTPFPRCGGFAREQRARVGEQIAVVWKRLNLSPSAANCSATASSTARRRPTGTEAHVVEQNHQHVGAPSGASLSGARGRAPADRGRRARRRRSPG